MADLFRKQFNAKLVNLNDDKGRSSLYLTTKRYKWVIHILNELKTGDAKKTSKDY